MLIYHVFQKHNFLKKACTKQWAVPTNSMNYTMFARWVYDLPGEFCRFLRSLGAGRSCRRNMDTGGDATGPGFSLSRRSGVRR